MNGESDQKQVYKLYAQNAEFDQYQVDRILNLLILKSRCLRQDTAMRYHFNFYEPAHTFFSAISLAIDNLLVDQVNDEVVASLADRGPTKALIKKVIQTAKLNSIVVPELAIIDFSDLFVNRTEFIIGSSFLDFIVGSYSVFEKYMVYIYNNIRPNYPPSGKKEKCVALLIEKYNNASPEEKENALRKVIDAGGSYVSGGGKIEFVMSKISSESYQRNLVEDREIIQFYAKCRNSIHDLGINTSNKDICLSIQGIEIKLLAGQPISVPDRSNITRLCGMLVEIYLAVFAENADLDINTFIRKDDELRPLDS